MSEGGSNAGNITRSARMVAWHPWRASGPRGDPDRVGPKSSECAGPLPPERVGEMRLVSPTTDPGTRFGWPCRASLFGIGNPGRATKVQRGCHATGTFPLHRGHSDRGESCKNRSCLSAESHIEQRRPLAASSREVDVPPSYDPVSGVSEEGLCSAELGSARVS